MNKEDNIIKEESVHYELNNLKSEHAPALREITILESFPEIENKAVNHQLPTLSQYKYRKDELESEHLPYIGPVILENDSVYFGQFKWGYKHGKGKQLFSNGALCEGFW